MSTDDGRISDVSEHGAWRRSNGWKRDDDQKPWACAFYSYVPQ